MPKENELGTLIVVVLKARNLNDKHSFYKQDVLAQASLNGIIKRTHVDVKGGQHPVWDAELRFPVLKNTDEKYRKLEVACYCKEHKSEDILGNGSVDITETLKTGEFDEWIPLNVNGVVRGDIYLEMTYYTSTPLPTATLAVPASDQVQLTRRPSKLSPSDRLHRPPQILSPSPETWPSHATFKAHQHPELKNVSHLGGDPPPRSSSGAPPKRSESPLPPLPEQPVSAPSLPQILIPRGGRTHPRLSDHQPPQIPSILRPRNEITSPRHAYSQAPPAAQKHDVSISLPYPGEHYYAGPSSPPFEYNPTLPRVNYHAQTTSTAPVVSYPLPTSPQTYGSNYAPSGPPSFPVPASPLQQSGNYPDSGSQPFFYRPPDRNDFPDPYLQARYHTPLPLPPGSAHPPSNPTALPLRSNHDSRVIRVDALPLKEEEAMRQKTQEEKDLELAVQLDRELNLAS